jgi:formate dehydrogenase maturation protein FdhE
MIEFQSRILDAQNSAFAANEERTALIDRVRELEKQVTKAEAWAAEMQRYELRQLPPSIFVYALKPDMAAGEPMHYICANCRSQGKKSILHGYGVSDGLETFHCDGCKSDWTTGYFRAPPERQRYAED